MARLQILIVAVLLTVAVGNTEANTSPAGWYQNPEAEMKLWKCVKKWSNYCLNKYGCHNKQGCLQNINNNVKKCVEFYNERCFAAQPGYSPCDENIWVRPVSSRPITATTTKFDQKGACRSNPCQNGGTCQLVANNTTSFKCICPDLIYGETCIDLCRSNSAEGINGMEGRGMELFLNFVGKYYIKPGTDAPNLPPGAKVSIFLFYFN
jgi:hypothetical protein